jgi:hypothetical protein
MSFGVSRREWDQSFGDKCWMDLGLDRDRGFPDWSGQKIGIKPYLMLDMAVDMIEMEREGMVAWV